MTEDFDFSGIVPSVATVVAEKNGVQLLEESIEYAGDPCTIEYLKDYFPDYPYKDDKQYYMIKDGEFYHGKITREFTD